MNNYSLAEKLRFINEQENNFDREAFDSMVKTLRESMIVCQDGSKLNRFFQKLPDRASDVINMLGIALLIASNPEYINRIKADANTTSLSYLGQRGWEQIKREFAQGINDLDEKGVNILKVAFTKAKILD